MLIRTVREMQKRGVMKTETTFTNPRGRETREQTLPELDSARRATFARISRILVPTDFTEASEHALGYATGFAAQLGAMVVVCHVYQLPTPLAGAELSTIPTPQASLEIDQAARLGVNNSIARHAREEVSFAAVVRPGDPELEIRTIAREVGADLIILGTHGRTGLMRLISGSVTDDVVHHADIPVLVLHGPRPSQSS